MDVTEKLALSTSLPALIGRVEVNTRFKAKLVASSVLDSDILDDLIERNNHVNGQDLLFKVVQLMKKGNKAGSFRKFQELLRETGQGGAADLLETEVVKHSRRSAVVTDTRSPASPGPSLIGKVGGSSPTRQVDPVGGVSSPTSSRSHASHQAPPLEELRREVRSCVGEQNRRRPLVGDVVVTKNYKRMVSDFAQGRRHDSPGPLQLETGHAALPPDAVHNSVITTYSPEVVARLSRLLGGSPQLMLRDHKSVYALTTQENQLKYISVKICFGHPRVESVRENFISAWFGPNAVIFDCIAAVRGMYPQRIVSKDRQEQERDVLNTEKVSEWFDWAKSITLYVVE